MLLVPCELIFQNYLPLLGKITTLGSIMIGISISCFSPLNLSLLLILMGSFLHVFHTSRIVGLV
jgi:hypothetical protein